VPLVYRKRRPVADRFSNDNTAVEIADPSDMYSSDEIGLILAFASTMGVDLGEFDVLRDRASGRLFIVDVATTPHGPPEMLVGRDGVRAMRIIARAFRRQYLHD